MKRKDYSYYTTEELLQDDYFISSMRHPTTESEDYWKCLVEEGKIKREDYEISRNFILYVQPPKSKLTKNESTDLWMKIEVENKKRLKKMIRHLYIFSSSVACLLLVVGVFWFTKEVKITRPIQAALQIEQIKKLDIQSNDIQLVLANNNQITLEEAQTDVEYSKKGEIKVNSKVIEQQVVSEEVSAEPAYNQLVTPKGRHSTLLLSDGSKLWVNAGTHVVYPVTFTGKNREIYVEGEVFLEVAHDKKHPFIVKTEKMDINVTGTSFNVCAYKNEQEQAVVLVTGSVNIKTVDKIETTLEPNQLFSHTSRGSRVKTVDVNDYILWKEGLYQYKSEKLSSILKRLSLYYGKQIECSESVASIVCSGKLDLKEDMDKVLSGLAATVRVKCEKKDGVYYISGK